MSKGKPNSMYLTFIGLFLLSFTWVILVETSFIPGLSMHSMNRSRPPLVEVVPASTKNTDPKSAPIVAYAGTLLGIPYKVGGKDEQGFDCSGFVAYVFKKFQLILPSSTKALILEGREVDLQESEPGDIIFFTGTDPNSREVGHAGIIVSHTSDSTQFIHSSSARSSACVKYTILEASPGYQRRFLKVKRVL